MAPMTSRFLDACRRRATDVRPVWFMRQAGRYLKPYRDIRAKHSILEICKRPELAAEVTLQPIEILDVDAAIVFADLLLPIEPNSQADKSNRKKAPSGRARWLSCIFPDPRSPWTSNSTDGRETTRLCASSRQGS